MDHHTPTFVLIPVGVWAAKKQRMMGTYTPLGTQYLRCEVSRENELLARLRSTVFKVHRAVLDMIRNA